MNTTELWFLPVANPDGYDFTFTEGNRLWRKNLRDNNGDGQITAGDGVDLNRNFAEKWGYDNEGSSPDPASETYRGTGPNSEPETKALDGLFRRVGFEFFVNYHSAAELLLYGIGWQVNTPSPGRRHRQGMVGTDENPAVPGYDPDISAELYTTNGDTDTHARCATARSASRRRCPRAQAASNSVPDDEWLAEDCVSDFIFPDDEELIQAEFARTFRSRCRSQSRRTIRTTRSRRSASTHPISWPTRSRSRTARSQPVAVTAKRALQEPPLHYSVNGGPARTPAGQGVARRRAVRRHARRLLRRVPRQGRAAKPGDRWRCGSPVASRARAGVDGALHLRGAYGHRRRCADPRRRGRHWRQPGAGR